MTRVLTRPTSPADERRTSSLAESVTRGCDRLIDGVVVLMASWTVVYHLCLVTRLNATWAVLIEVAVLIAWIVVARRHRSRETLEDDREEVVGTVASEGIERSLAWLAVGSALGSGLLFALDGNWPWTVTLWLIASAAGLWWAAARLRRAPARPLIESGARLVDRTEVIVALALAVAMAAMTTVLRKPNPDDWFYVNLSQWVVDHGTFPIRDTIFGNLVYPMANWPPSASYDPLVGVVARLFGAQAGTVAYVVVPPLVTLLSVLALWRLLRTWRARPGWLALALAVAFLLFDDGPSYGTPGDLFVTRLWQGKVILLCLMVPVLLAYAVRYVERVGHERGLGSSAARASLGWMFLAGTAAVGMSTTATFLVPIVAVGTMAPLLVRRRFREAAAGFAAMACYPIATGIVTVAVDGHSADDFGSRELFRFDPQWFGHAIFLDGVFAFVVVSCVLVGALLLPHPDARVMTAVLVGITGITFIPGFTDLSYDALGLGPTLWRVSWVCTIAALVGVVGTAAVRDDRWPKATRYAAPLALVAVLVVTGSPIWTSGAGVSTKTPWEWQRDKYSMAAAKEILAVAPPGTVVLAPKGLSVTLEVSNTDVKTVAPRDYIMDYLRDEPGFMFQDRLALIHFVDLPEDEDFSAPEVRAALAAVRPDMVCLYRGTPDREEFLRRNDYVPGVRTPSFHCFDRSTS